MKPGTAKAKGRDTENLCVEYLQEWGVLHAERRRLTGSKDCGDITGWPGVCVEVKSGARIDLPGWMGELMAEIENSGAETGFVAIRPKGQPHPSKWYAALPLPVLLRLMHDAGWMAGEVAA